MKRRTVLVGLAAALPGCASLDLGSRDTSEDDQPLVRAGAVDYAHDIRVDNSLDRRVSIGLSVEQDGSTLYEGHHEVEPGVETAVAGFTRESFPSDRQYVIVRAETDGGEAASVGVSVTDCLGNVVVAFDEDGAPWLTYSIC